MANDYCLSCPACGNDTKFGILARHTITINDGAIESDHCLQWENDDEVTCGVCYHEGKAKSFVLD